MSLIRESLRHISDLVSNELDESHVHALTDEPGYGVTDEPGYGVTFPILNIEKQM